jgi:cytidine deaminase
MPNQFSCPDAPEWEPLLDAAWSARDKAYAPYSGFSVGAAVLLDNGCIAAGCNVENAAYPLALCAERSALAAAVAQAGARPGQLAALAIVADSPDPTLPCGACRQALAEFADDLPILAANGTNRVLHSLKNLLPEAFSSQNLRKKYSAKS